MNEKELEFVHRALDEAERSESGGNDDPKVGAVVVRDGKILGVAHRGQSEKGRHAEFCLLQKVLRSKDESEGATLYTTLEPCTTRSHDKLPCVEWIIRKGVRRVVIGILDPNPTICGKGYWRLLDSRIRVDFFPSEFARALCGINSRFINAHRGGQGVTPTFAWQIGLMKTARIAPYTGIGWGDDLSLLKFPKTSIQQREGWPISKVEIRLNNREYALPSQYTKAFKTFYKSRFKEKRFKDDSQKFMLAKNPIAFSDSPSLSIDIRPTRYSHIQFFRDEVATVPAKCNLLIDDLIKGSQFAGFPNAFCLHTVVVTSDSKILLTKRSPKVVYYPGTWSGSVEEQMSSEDVQQGAKSAARHWGCRLIREELGLGDDAFRKDDFRILSVFLESDILNVSLCAYVELLLDADKLDTHLRHAPRTDYEFTEWTFIDLDKKTLLSELFHPTRYYMPTTGYRLLHTFLRHFGIPKDSDLDQIVSRRPDA